MSVLPPSFCRASVAERIETWVLKPVVAPQLRLNTTALRLPDGDETVWEISFPHMSPQPPRAERQKKRAINWSERLMQPNEQAKRMAVGQSA